MFNTTAILIPLMLLGLVFCTAKNHSQIKQFAHKYLTSLIVIFFVSAIIVFPASSVNAAHQGLTTWFAIVVPALLPFFIGAEILIGLGVVKLIGILLEPVMRPVFNVPGEGAFAFAMSVTSGYPVGAKIICKLYKQRALTTHEAQRLMSFCSTSGPLFIIGAVGVGMFHSGVLGLFIAANHYFAAIAIGVMFSFYKKDKNNNSATCQKHYQGKKLIEELSEYSKSNLSFGHIMGNAVKESVDTILLVGGFIILFSVVVNILNQIGLVNLITSIIHTIPHFFSINPSVINSVTTGFFEITLGCKMLSEVYCISLQTRLSIVAFIISWSGFPVHAQTLSIIRDTGIKTSIYLLSKFAHGIFASIFSFIFFLSSQN